MKSLRLLLLLPLLALCARAQIQQLPPDSTISSTFGLINDNFLYLDTHGNGSPTIPCTVAVVGQKYFRVDAGAPFQSVYYCENIGAGIYGWVGPYGTNSGGPAGSVTSVGLSLPGIFAVTGSPVTTSGTLSGTLVSQSANTFFAAPSGAAGVPSFRLLSLTDLPTIAASNLSNGITGSGQIVLNTNPILVTPNLGTPSVLNLANATGLPLSTGVSGTLSHSNITSTAVTPGSYTNANITVQSDGTITAASNGTSGGNNYQLFEANGTPVTQRAKFNLAAGANMTVTPTDNGTDTTTFTIASTGGGSGSGNANVVGMTITSSTVTLFGNCTTAGSPCFISKGHELIDTVSATNTISNSGLAAVAGTMYIAWNGSGCEIVVPSGVTITVTGSGPCNGVTATVGTGYPADATAIVGSVDFSAGTWNTVHNAQPTAVNPYIYTAGTGLIQTTSPGHVQFAVDGSAIPFGNGASNNVARWTGTSTLGTGLIFDDGVNGVGIGAAASTQSGFQETFSETNNTSGFNLVGLHNNNPAGTSEWEVYGASGSGHLALGVNNDSTNGYSYLNAGVGTKGFYIGTAHGDFHFEMNNAVANPTSADATAIWSGGGIWTNGTLQLGTVTPPSCAGTTDGGKFVYQHINGTTKDNVQVCAQDASGTFAWRTIY